MIQIGSKINSSYIYNVIMSVVKQWLSCLCAVQEQETFLVKSRLSQTKSWKLTMIWAQNALKEGRIAMTT